MVNTEISEISDKAIKTALLRLVEKRAKSKNVKVCIEPGSKKGKTKNIHHKFLLSS